MVLRENGSQRRFDVNDFNPRVVTGKQFQPTPAHLPREVGGIEGEVPSCAEVFPALLARGLNDRALIVGGSHIELSANGVERLDRQTRTMPRQPGVLARARKA